jgi:hypothetical protein
MKTLAIICFALAAACAKQPPPPAPLTVQDVAAPRDRSTSAIAGVVKARDYREVMLDSGGPNPIPLRVDPGMQVLKDDRPGDIVRAAYRLDDSGVPTAITVVANSRPVSGRATTPQRPARAR